MPDQLKVFTLEGLAELHGGDVKADFETVLQALVKDCTSRPAIKKKRQVSIVIDVEPILAKDGTCDNVAVSVQVASKQPARVVPTHVMQATVKGGLKYNPDSPSDPDQKTIFDPES